MTADFMARFTAAVHAAPGSIDPSQPLKDLGVDSFELVDILVRLQEELGVRIFQEDLAGVQTVGDLQAVFASRRGA
jgi:acyl carrier protein